MNIKVSLKGIRKGDGFAVMHRVADAMKAAIADYIARAGAAKTFKELMAITKATVEIDE